MARTAMPTRYVSALAIALSVVLPSAGAAGGRTALCGRTFSDARELLDALIASGARVVEDGRTSLSVDDAGSGTTWVFVLPGLATSGIYCRRRGSPPEVACGGRQEACDALVGTTGR